MSNPTFLDTSSLQYAPWRVFLILTNPGPLPSIGAFSSAAVQPPTTSIMDDEYTLWFFDAVIRIDHIETQKITQHPVQTGANISDHSYGMPATVTMEIGMSDVMEGWMPGQWGTDESTPSRSVKAYQQLVEWKKLGMPLTLMTRLQTYSNMVIQHMSAPDDYKTSMGLKCVVTFQQIFVADVSEEPASVNKQATVEVNKGVELSVPQTSISGVEFPFLPKAK